MSSAVSTPAKTVTFKRDPNYWGRALPINRGLWNFAELQFDFYRDSKAPIRLVRPGCTMYGPRPIPGAGKPATVSLRLDGRIVKEAFPSGLPKFASVCLQRGGNFC